MGVSSRPCICGGDAGLRPPLSAPDRKKTTRSCNVGESFRCESVGTKSGVPAPLLIRPSVLCATDAEVHMKSHLPPTQRHARLTLVELPAVSKRKRAAFT